jgi:alkanesulfonate monooxygenase SsuD/methylene tetrahydromethanopterin reductase-like flavin-dependent oxidoreductase (luciferase family)
MRFCYFHLMPYLHMPPDYLERQTSSWATLPNSYFDPELGSDLYNEYLDILERADRLGFEYIAVNEHHQTCYGLMPAPNIIAAALARRTSRAKIAILGNAINLRDHPLRVAEEVAMLDVITRGRIVSGFVRGIGAEFASFSLRPTTARDRFYEALDLIVRAWTEPGPFAFEGTHYSVRYVNPWPRPYQKPHPPIWMPSMGSAETISFAAQHRHPYIQIYSPFDQVRLLHQEYKEEARKAGYEAAPEQLGWAAPIYVAETDAQAWAEAEPHLDALFNRFLRMPPEMLFPPGYVSETSYARIVGDKMKTMTRRTDPRDLLDKRTVVVGSPATVRDVIQNCHRQSGLGLLVSVLQFGTLPHALARKNLELFAAEVMPYFRDATEGDGTRRESGGAPAQPATARG